MKCGHKRVRESDPRGFTRAVYVHPYTHENRAAHGGIEYTEECLDCKAKRLVLSNGRHQEYGVWRKGEYC